MSPRNWSIWDSAYPNPCSEEKIIKPVTDENFDEIFEEKFGITVQDLRDLLQDLLPEKYI